MAEPFLHQPHDRLIRYTYTRKQSALGILQGYLPESMLPGMDWATLKVMPGSFVDASLKGLHSDILYQIQFRGSPLYLHFLFEHQSKPDPWMGLRIMGYKRAIWQQILGEAPKASEVPPIYPLVVYSGKAAWNVPLNWSKKIAFPESAAPELVAMEMQFGYQLINLSHLSANEIRGDLAGRLTLSLMKAAAEDQVEQWLRNAGPLLKSLQQSEVTGMFEALLRYLLAVDSSMTREHVFIALEDSAPPEFIQQAMSIADQLLAEGRQEGLLYGKIQTLQELLGVPVSSENVLSTKSEEELRSLAKELQARIAKG